MKKYLPTIIPIISAIVIAVITDKLTKIDIIDKLLKGITNIFSYLSFRIETPVWLLVIFILAPILIWYLTNQPVIKKIVHDRNLSFSINRKQPRTLPDIDTLIKGNELTAEAQLCILGYQNHSPILAYKKGLCCSDYEPGTFTLAEISPDASFLKEGMSFIEWADKTLNQEIGYLETIFPNLFKQRSIAETKELTKKILTMNGPIGRTLHQEIWFQEYSDILRRIILMVTINNPDLEIDIYPNLTTKRKKIAFDILKQLEETKWITKSSLTT